MWTKAEINNGQYATTFYYRHVIDCVYYLIHLVAYRSDMLYEPIVRREPISKSCEITQADNLNRRRRLSRKAQCFKIEVGKVIKIFLA